MKRRSRQKRVAARSAGAVWALVFQALLLFFCCTGVAGEGLSRLILPEPKIIEQNSTGEWSWTDYLITFDQFEEKFREIEKQSGLIATSYQIDEDARREFTNRKMTVLRAETAPALDGNPPGTCRCRCIPGGGRRR